MKNDITVSNNLPSELDILAEKYGSDKGYIDWEGEKPYAWKPHNYTRYYSRLFSHCRNHFTKVFECGLGTNNEDVLSNMGSKGMPGASLRMWRDYFPNANVYGADVDERVLFTEDRISTYYVNQLNDLDIENMWNNISETDFDLIVDDGLHTYEAGLSLFINSFDRLRRGGVYIIEDVKQEYMNALKDAILEHRDDVVVDTVELTINGLRYEPYDNNLLDIRWKS